jgi:hypothetical protein
MRVVRLRKYLPAAASIAGPCCSFGNWKPLISLGFSPWHGACCSTDEPLTARPSWSFAMLPALGAASAALDAIASLTTPNPASSSQPTGFGPFSPGPVGSSSAQIRHWPPALPEVRRYRRTISARCSRHRASSRISIRRTQSRRCRRQRPVRATRLHSITTHLRPIAISVSSLSNRQFRFRSRSAFEPVRASLSFKTIAPRRQCAREGQRSRGMNAPRDRSRNHIGRDHA